MYININDIMWTVCLTRVVVHGDGGADEAEVGDDRPPVRVQHDVVRLAGHKKGGTQGTQKSISQALGQTVAITLVRVPPPSDPFKSTID